ncbi:hypothetical protein [Nitrospirillum viridazoti]|uniref:hypothetical protein n=1 Tax=Nitrospirillum viridazoti TaxID=3144925 RepID=UPI0011AA9186|nr:hypothetical protein [Nitrospirillum amazonense]
MSRQHTSFVLGYHGCERQIGEKIIAGEDNLVISKKNHDWLGHGAYFWEGDPKRALEWANDRKERGKIYEPFILGAVIDLGNCLDATTRDGAAIIETAHQSLQAKLEAGRYSTLPENTKDGRHYLDCMVIEEAHLIATDGNLPPFETVRALFPEGVPLFPNASFWTKTHIQIAVCNRANIKGFFRAPSVEDLL